MTCENNIVGLHKYTQNVGKRKIILLLATFNGYSQNTIMTFENNIFGFHRIHTKFRKMKKTIFENNIIASNIQRLQQKQHYDVRK